MPAWEYDVKDALKGVDTRGISAEQRGILLSFAASIVMGTIVSAWPVDTALSIAGFRTRKKGRTWVVYNEVEYVPYVHDGLVERLAREGIATAKPEMRRRAKALREGTPGKEIGGRVKLRRRSAGGRRVATTPVRVSTASASAARISATKLRDAIAIVGPLVAAGAVPREVLRNVRAGSLILAARKLRDKGFVREARKLEDISRRGREV